MVVPRARLLNLMKAQCEIFSTTYNPEGIRTGNKILHQRLKGPSVVKYYPPKGPGLSDLFKQFKHLELEGINERFERKQEHIAELKARGKGPPKKKRKAPEKPGKK